MRGKVLRMKLSRESVNEIGGEYVHTLTGYPFAIELDLGHGRQRPIATRGIAGDVDIADLQKANLAEGKVFLENAHYWVRGYQCVPR